MAHTHILVSPGYRKGTVLSDKDEVMIPPSDWSFLPAGDGAITRNVKSRGTTWVVQVRKGKRIISKGIWAKESHISAAQKEVEDKRSTPEYSKRRQQEQIRKSNKQKAFQEEFYEQIILYLSFHEKYEKEAQMIAHHVTVHATPVGSGTVARASRVPVEKKAEAAVIAWMRHQTTSYDSMKIARVKGKRREIRRQLAAQTIRLLEKYRQGEETGERCPLKLALGNSA